ncbi:hypothetical protein RB195_012405 [Necator americanus]|uniref:Uncharacterized protein n=1 Tax=Necator americanus TaxID=51031 RepID=A0ABR1D6X3_NECAM
MWSVCLFYEAYEKEEEEEEDEEEEEEENAAESRDEGSVRRETDGEWESSERSAAAIDTRQKEPPPPRALAEGEISREGMWEGEAMGGVVRKDQTVRGLITNLSGNDKNEISVE